MSDISAAKVYEISVTAKFEHYFMSIWQIGLYLIIFTPR